MAIDEDQADVLQVGEHQRKDIMCGGESGGVAPLALARSCYGQFVVVWSQGQTVPMVP